MLQYKNARFYFEQVSFEIPEGFYLAELPEEDGEESIVLFEPEQRVRIMIQLIPECLCAEQGLKQLFLDCPSLKLMDEITPITLNGRNGVQAFYNSKTEQYYEVRLDLDTELTQGNIVVVVSAAQADDITLMQPSIEKLLQSIQ